MLISKVKENLPEYTEWHQRLVYVDPLNSAGSIDIFFSKHFRYAYQKEYRIVWLPPVAHQKLSPLIVEVGSLSNYADFFAI
jgi:hypothetical protein